MDFEEVSVPENKDFFALENIFVADDLFSEYISIVRNLSPHVIDKERLREVVFVIRIRHGLEVERHGRTALHVSNLILSNCRVAVGVEELGE